MVHIRESMGLVYNVYGKHKRIGPLYQLMHYTGTRRETSLPTSTCVCQQDFGSIGYCLSFSDVFHFVHYGRRNAAYIHISEQLSPILSVNATQVHSALSSFGNHHIKSLKI